MLFMVIERFEGNNMLPVYERVNQKGRGLPDELKYINSWDRTELRQVLSTYGMRGPEAIPAVGAALARYGGELRDRARRREQPSARGRGSLPEQAVNTLASRVTPPPADVLPQAAPASGRRSLSLQEPRC